MKHKSEARILLIHFIYLVENQFGKNVKVVRSDNGPEFKISQFYSSKGIIHQTSCVNTPQQNGVAERKHRHLLNVVRALFFQATLPKHFWGDAILTAAYLINRTPTPILKGKTPFEHLFHKEPGYSHLKVFGCQCFVSTHPTRPSKFDPRSTECIFLGYPHGQKGYKVYNLTTKKILISRDVIFFEHVFPFKTNSASHSLPHLPIFTPVISHPYYPQNPHSSADHHSPDTTPPSNPIYTPLTQITPPLTDLNSSIPSENNPAPDTSFSSISSPLQSLQLPSP
jgi:transposase InsO family protein